MLKDMVKEATKQLKVSDHPTQGPFHCLYVQERDKQVEELKAELQARDDQIEQLQNEMTAQIEELKKQAEVSSSSYGV